MPKKINQRQERMIARAERAGKGADFVRGMEDEFLRKTLGGLDYRAASIDSRDPDQLERADEYTAGVEYAAGLRIL